MPGFQRGRGAAQNYLRAFQTGPHHREVAPVVARIVVLFVGLFVFLINDDQAQIGQRGKHRAAGADHDLALAAGDLLPLLQALAVAQLAVADGQDGAEFSLEAFHHLWREGDLGDEENDAFAFGQIAANDRNIHFRLAAAGDAEKQLHVEGTVSGSDALNGGLLFLCKGYRFGRGLRVILEKGAFHLFRIDGNDFLFLQGMEH